MSGPAQDGLAQRNPTSHHGVAVGVRWANPFCTRLEPGAAASLRERGNPQVLTSFRVVAPSHRPPRPG